jgi:hypothetical protein
MQNEFVYYFGNGRADGSREDKSSWGARARTWRR